MKSLGSWALVSAMIMLTMLYVFMYYRVFKLRRCLDIAARSPVLSVLAGFGNLVMANAVLLHQVLLLEREGLPCFAVFWPSYAWFAFSCTPYCLRACRLVVAYNTNYRIRFARFVKTRTLTKTWALSSLCILGYACAVFVNMQDRYARGNYGCFFFNEKLGLEIGFGLCIAPAWFLIFKLSEVDDAYGIKYEIASVLIGGLFAGALQFSLLEMVAADILPTSQAVHMVSGIIMLAPNLNALCWSTVVPLSFHARFGKRRVMPSSASRRVYHSTSFASREREPTCLRYAREGGEVATLFGEYCRHCLCEESWEFIVEGVAYEDMSHVNELFPAFMGIVDTYIKPTSPQEINISSAMKASMKTFQTREVFSALDETARRSVLGPPMLEMCRMLEQNLLCRFRNTPEMKLRLERRKQREMEMAQAKCDVGEDAEMLELLNCISTANSEESGSTP